MAKDFTTPKEDALEAENTGLRQMLAQAGIDASQLLTKAGIDATEQEAAARLQRLLLEELHHRVKNTLATVMAITSQSLKNATSMEQGREAIAHRLIALGRAHDLLLQTSWTSASLPTVVRAAIGPFDTPGAERFIVLGTEINVGPAAVLSLALALNELCTNAVKFGALSNAEGHVEITSVLDEKAQRFKLIWAEKGGPLSKNRPNMVLERSSSSAALPDYSMVMLDCGLNPQASYANLIFLSPRCGRPSDGSARCPLLAQSGHPPLHRTCPLSG